MLHNPLLTESVYHFTHRPAPERIRAYIDGAMREVVVWGIARKLCDLLICVSYTYVIPLCFLSAAVNTRGLEGKFMSCHVYYVMSE